MQFPPNLRKLDTEYVQRRKCISVRFGCQCGYCSAFASCLKTGAGKATLFWRASVKLHLASTLTPYDITERLGKMQVLRRGGRHLHCCSVCPKSFLNRFAFILTCTFLNLCGTRWRTLVTSVCSALCVCVCVCAYTDRLTVSGLQQQQPVSWCC